MDMVTLACVAFHVPVYMNKRCCLLSRLQMSKQKLNTKENSFQEYMYLTETAPVVIDRMEGGLKKN